mgnify:CR=1 FL=1
MAVGRSCPDCFAFRAVTCNGTGANFSSFAQLRRMVRHLAALPSQKFPAARFSRAFASRRPSRQKVNLQRSFLDHIFAMRHFESVRVVTIVMVTQNEKHGLARPIVW